VSNKKLIFEARMRANRFGSATTIGSLLDELADALEATESPTTVEWGVRIAGGRAGTSKVSDEAAAQAWVAECEGEYRYTREVVRRTAAGPWEVVAP